MNAAARDTRLPLQARAIAFWILDNPSEGIDPDIIAKANDLAVSYVRKLLAKLAEFGHLIAPKKYRAEKGRIAYTAYELPPQDKITVTVEEPSRSETPHGQNNQNGQEAAPVETAAGQSSTTEYVHEGEGAAGDKDGLLSLKAKNSLVLSEKDNQTDSLKPENTRTQNVAPVDEFEDEPATEIDRPVYEQDNGFGKAAAAYLERIGLLPNLMLDELADVVKEYGWYPVKLAIHGAADEVAKAQRGERTPIKTSTWNYAKGTLRKQKSEGDLPVEPVELVFEPDAPPEPEIEPAPVIQTVTVVPGGGEQWRELGELVKSQNVELYRRYLSQCRFGGIDAGILTVQVMTERIQNACRMELNHGGRFQDWCESIWQDLKAVEFVLEDLQYAHPATG